MTLDKDFDGVLMNVTNIGKNALREEVMRPLAELEPIIAAMGPDDLADDDYIDSETGEFYLEKGRPARSSELHPEYGRDRVAARVVRDEENAREEAEWAKEDEEWENEKARSKQEAEAAWMAALSEYAGNWTDFKQSMSADFDGEGDMGSTAAFDAALGFFHHYPDWRRWAAELGMKKADMQSAVADFVYEAITTGQVPIR